MFVEGTDYLIAGVNIHSYWTDIHTREENKLLFMVCNKKRSIRSPPAVAVYEW